VSRLSRADRLARERRKKEIRARPEPKVPEECRGVTVIERVRRAPPDGLGEAMGVMAALIMRGKLKRSQDFWGPVKRK